MKKLIPLFLALVGSAHAGVMASPSFYHFGDVEQGTTQMTVITFHNMDARPVPSFHVDCNGDWDAFSCNSFCYQLSPYGSCSVYVYFTPRNGDRLQRRVDVQGWGVGAFATSQVLGRDMPRRNP